MLLSIFDKPTKYYVVNLADIIVSTPFCHMYVVVCVWLTLVYPLQAMTSW